MGLFASLFGKPDRRTLANQAALLLKQIRHAAGRREEAVIAYRSMLAASDPDDDFSDLRCRFVRIKLAGLGA